jgi:hypothetical protein
MKHFKFIILTILLLAFTAGAVLPAAASDGGTDVAKEKFDFNKNILISIFWPPTKDYITDEQYKYMADAEIDWVLGAGDGIGSKTSQMKMLELCSKYGIGMCVGDDRFGGNLLNMSPTKIKKLVEEYKDVPGAYGYYMLDEPYNANQFIDAYRALKEADPDGYMHLNFLPGHAYPSWRLYESQMNDWLKLCASTGYPQEYVMYDMYPFGLTKNSISREVMMCNLESVRKVGLKNDVKTAMYIQSVCQQVAFRSLNREETLFEFNIGLAFGIKQFSYFTWFTPYNRNEPFDDGIITYQGVPNPKYEFICEIDHMIHNVGKTLINLDALEVYGSEKGYSAIDVLPDDFFLKVNGRSDLTVSYMKDKKTGRNYCMVVNNLFTKKQTFELEFDSDINKLQYVSYDDGEFHDLEMSGNKVSVSLGKGEAILMALPEGYDYSAKHVKTYAPTDNLALDAEIMCTSSEGANGWYMDNLNDGTRFSNSGVQGWSSAGKTGLDTITVDLGKALDINRIDLYPAGLDDGYGAYMPNSFNVSYSKDGQTWYNLAKASGITIKENSAPSLKSDKVNARYVKIEITECTDKKSQLCEIEIYNDDGTVPGVEVLPGSLTDPLADDTPTPVSYKKDANLAKNKKVIVSSYPGGGDYKVWGWWPDYLVDENMSTGWTSNVKLHMNTTDATEYAIIDLGDEFNIEKIEMYALGCWPKDFTVSVSSDGKTYKNVAEEKNCAEPDEKYVVEPQSVNGRFIKINATKLRTTAADGAMLQLGEVKVYGTPHIDKDGAKADMELYLSNGGNKDTAEYKAVADALENENTTQKKLNQLINAMLDSKNIVKEKETEAETEAVTAAEYEFDYSVLERPEETTSEVTETETDKATEPDTDTKAEPTETEAGTETDKTKDNGDNNALKTGLIIGGAIAAAAIIAGAVILVLKKKKK